MAAHNARPPRKGVGILCSITCAVLLICLLFSGSAAFSVQPLPFGLIAPYRMPPVLALSEEERQWLAEHEMITVGVNISGYEPIDIVDDHNRFQGISADYLALVSAQFGLPVRVLAYRDASDAIMALRQGDIDVLAGANGFERGQGLRLFSRQYLADRAVVLGRQDDPGLTRDLAGLKVAVQDGYIDVAELDKAYPRTEIVLSPSLLSGLDAVSQGHVDAFIGNEIVLGRQQLQRPYLGVVARFDSRLPPSGFAFAFDETRGERLHGLFDRALANLGQEYAQEIRSRWGTIDEYPSIRGGVKFTMIERSWLRRHPVVTLAESPRVPYLRRNAKGEWEGLTADVLKRISRVTGLTFRFIEKQGTEAVLEALEQGEADISASLTETLGRRQLLDFTYAFGGSNWMFVVPKHRISPTSLEQLDGMVLALPARHALEEIIQRRYPRIELRTVTNYTQARQMVEAGTADLTIHSEHTARKLESKALKAGDIVEGVWAPKRFSVTKRQPELLSILNKALEDFPASELRAIDDRWLGSGVSPRPWWKCWDSWLYVAGLALPISMLSFYGYRRFRADARCSTRLEDRLGQQHAFQRAMLDGIPQPIFLLDAHARVVACNQCFEQLTGVSFEQLSGRHLIDVSVFPGMLGRYLHDCSLAVLRDIQPLAQPWRGGDGVMARHWFTPFQSACGASQGVMGGWQQEDMAVCTQDNGTSAVTLKPHP